MKFSIGYNQKPDFFYLLDKFKENISSVYFPLPYSIGNSGRDEEQLDKYETELIYELIRNCKSKGISSILIINATCEGENTGDKTYMLKLISYIKKLYGIGLDSITLSNLLYVPFIKKALPDLKIFSSINCYLKTFEQAIYFKDIGIDILTIDRDINRDLELIRKIKSKTGLPIQMLLNEGCMSNCPYRQTHFNIAAHRVDYNKEERLKKGNYNLIENFSCVPLVERNKKLIFRAPFVRPEDISRYDGLVDIYKLDTRPESTQRIELMLQAYINGFYKGDLRDIIDFPYQNVPYINNDKLTDLHFFEKMLKCPKDCSICNVCDLFL